MDIAWYLVALGADVLRSAPPACCPPQPAGDPALPRADAERRQPRAGRLRAHARQRGRPDLRADRDGRRRLRGRRRPRPHRRAVPPPAADRRRRAAGAARDERSRPAAWLVLALPARRHARHRASAGRVLAGRASPAGSAPPRSRSPSSARDRRARQAAGPARGRAPGRTSSLWDLRERRRRRHPARRSCVDPLSVFMVPGRHRRLDADPPLLGRLHELATAATRASSPTSTSSSSRCCCWSWRATSCC